MYVCMCIYICIYTHIHIHVQSIVKYSDGEFVKIVNDLWQLTIFAKALSGMLGWVLNVFEIISFTLFISYSLITLSIYSFIHLFYSSICLFILFLFINLCVCFKSVYTGHFSLLFPCVSMFDHFCLRNLYMKIFVKTFFSLLIKLQNTIPRNIFQKCRFCFFT